MAFSHQLRVRYGECDPQGIVFNPNYLAYFDHTVTELWRASSLGSWESMVERGVDVVVGEANLRFRAPARFDDLLDDQRRDREVRHDQPDAGAAASGAATSC